jgi:signal transduction histidine kinase
MPVGRTDRARPSGDQAAGLRTALVWAVALAYLPVAYLLWPAFPDVLDFGSHGRTFGRFLELALAGLWVPAGIVVYLHRQQRRIGLLMMLTGWLRSSLALIFGSTTPAAFTLGLLLNPLSWPLWTYLVLSYPEGRLHSRLERALVWAEVVSAILYGYVMRLFWDPLPFTGWEGLNLLVVWDRPDIVARYFDTYDYAYAALKGILLAAIFAVRLSRARGAARRILAPLAMPVIAYGVAEALMRGLLTHEHVERVFLSGDVRYDFTAAPLLVLLRSVKELGLLVVPLGFLLGLELARRRRRRLLDIVTQLGNEDQEAELEASLRRAVRDPTLRLVYPSDRSGTFVDEVGSPVAIPAEDDPTRVLTPLRADGILLAGVVHDRALTTDPRFLEALTAATRLAVARRRLTEEIRARAPGASVSGAEAHAAIEAERRRIGRDLHDGAQQRLANLALLLEMAGSTIDSPEAVARLKLLREEVDAAMRDVRQLARGLAPPRLEQDGLAGALDALAESSGVVRVSAAPARRWPPDVERAAYFVVSEAVANALKHAGATDVVIGVAERAESLEVEVRDNGVGGADLAGGGLAGLAERVRALGGRFSVDSSTRGTTVRASFPRADRAEPAS